MSPVDAEGTPPAVAPGAAARTPAADLPGDSVTVVIPVHNGESTLGEQLEALRTQSDTQPFSVIVVNNNSTDRTAAVAQGFVDRDPRFRLMDCPAPGASAARSAGLDQVETDIVLFCDADDVVDVHWVREMRAVLRTADAAGGAIDSVSISTPESIGWTPEHPDGLPVVANFLPRAISANLGVRTAAARAIGGPNPSYHYGSEDTEFCWRLQLAGYSLVHAEKAIVRYRRREDLAASLRRSYAIGKARPHLYKDFREHGMPRSLTGGLARLGRLALAAPAAARHKEQRPVWLREAHAARGRLVGSVIHRTLYL